MNLDTLLDSIGINDRVTIIKIRYGIEIVKNEFTKFVILCFISLIFGYFIEFAFSFSVLLLVRTFSGGMHMKSNIGCFIYTLCFLILVIVILPRISLSNIVAFSILSISSIVISFLAPTPNSNRPISTKHRYQSLKTRSIILVALTYAVLTVLYYYNVVSLFNIGLWVVCLQALQMLIASINNKGKEEI
jgi:accessory gene regulator B